MKKSVKIESKLKIRLNIFDTKFLIGFPINFVNTTYVWYHFLDSCAYNFYKINNNKKNVNSKSFTSKHCTKSEIKFVLPSQFDKQ